MTSATLGYIALACSVVSLALGIARLPWYLAIGLGILVGAIYGNELGQATVQIIAGIGVQVAIYWLGRGLRLLKPASK